MRPGLRYLWLALGLVLAWMPFAWAQQGAQELFVQLQELPQLHAARVLEQQLRSGQEKIYPLGSVRRISGRLRYTDELLVQGQQSWLTLQLAPTHGAPEAFTAIKQQLQRQAALLYWCEGRDCGPSNLWANTVFGNAQLYGPDDGQSYAVFALESGRELLLVYAVTRGNGRAMLHLEHVLAEQLPALTPGADTLLRQLRSGETLKIGALSPELLVQVLRRVGSMQIEIGGVGAQHWYEQLLAGGAPGRSLLLVDDQQPEVYLRAVP